MNKLLNNKLNQSLLIGKLPIQKLNDCFVYSNKKGAGQWAVFIRIDKRGAVVFGSECPRSSTKLVLVFTVMLEINLFLLNWNK